MPTAAAPFTQDRRPTVIALTLLAHVALVLCWQAGRKLPAADTPDARRPMLWILPALRPAPAPAPAPAEPAHARPRAAAPAHAAPLPLPSVPAPISVVPAQSAAPAATAAPATPATLSASPPATPSAADILASARRSIGGIDRALRKENRAYITAPPDSPQIRLRKGMEAAADMAPNAWYQAPKSEELVNNTGDGARRTRVITGNGTYCVTERSPATSIDMIEKHGKLRLTNCPAHESPANAQDWRSARD